MQIGSGLAFWIVCCSIVVAVTQLLTKNGSSGEREDSEKGSSCATDCSGETDELRARVAPSSLMISPVRGKSACGEDCMDRGRPQDGTGTMGVI